MKPLIFGTLILLLMQGACFPQEAESTLLSIKSPEELADWLSKDFTYCLKMPDVAQTTQETLQTKAGDCEDFANLASSVLTRIGIPNEVVVIKFRGLKIKHAICAWKNKDGYYSFISNQELYHTRKADLEQAVKIYYPDCEKITRSYLRSNTSL